MSSPGGTPPVPGMAVANPLPVRCVRSRTDMPDGDGLTIYTYRIPSRAIVTARQFWNELTFPAAPSLLGVRLFEGGNDVGRDTAALGKVVAVLLRPFADRFR